ncbi:hypothetical protein [Pseudobacteroides cellulosolvens]|uniref:YqzN/YkzM domain-containing protein n=1 Tax=Pseudobacteroides cellulosolvens ATCC 35603 = DSM 2933 TaxID=398512 RepID=A0A0L6JKP3_9FIRM|nr:hypothetical protein [Pseudobacteroides cellulosolvens]KNY26325.1 hypothetical protein Bccel_1587 [Pseudobacteroides cellulosolvens ATCC 35603 = DSM 2933]
MSKKEIETISKYTKEQILNSKKFSSYNKDVIMAILKDDCTYSIEEAENLINAFLERVV